MNESVAPIDPSIQAQVLAAALQPLNQFHGKTMVIKYGGNAMTEPALQKSFAHDIAELQKMGINPVVVHGGGPQINNLLEKIGKKGEFIQGMRVTDAETMLAVQWALLGEVQQAVVGFINTAGGKAVGLSGRDGAMVLAKQLKLVDVNDASKVHDVGQVGDVVKMDVGIIKTLQAAGYIPVVSPVGYGENGESYNINADVVASHLAISLQAEKLLMLSNIAGVLDKEGKLLTHLSAEKIDALIQDGTISGGMIPKIEGALDAAKRGVQSVHIIDGRVPHALLLEILTETALGTMISNAA